MDALERRIVMRLEKRRDLLWDKFQRGGGRGVALAEHIDRLTAALDALRGTLRCPHCNRQLTGNS